MSFPYEGQRHRIRAIVQSLEWPHEILDLVRRRLGGHPLKLGRHPLGHPRHAGRPARQPPSAGGRHPRGAVLPLQPRARLGQRALRRVARPRQQPRRIARPAQADQLGAKLGHHAAVARGRALHRFGRDRLRRHRPCVLDAQGLGRARAVHLERRLQSVDRRRRPAEHHPAQSRPQPLRASAQRQHDRHPH